MSNTWQHIRGLWRAAEDRPVATRDTVRCLRRHHHERAIIERMAHFNDFVRLTNDRPFVWGASDCSMMVADWCVENGHADPAVDWRGAYATEAECRARIAKEGDLASIWGDCAAAIGLKRIHEPEFGCIAVIGSPHVPERQWSAIWSGARWAVRWGNTDGATWTPMAARALGMWRV